MFAEIPLLNNGKEMGELRWGGQRGLNGGEEFIKTVQNVVVTSNNTLCANLSNKTKNTHIPNS